MNYREFLSNEPRSKIKNPHQQTFIRELKYKQFTFFGNIHMALFPPQLVHHRFYYLKFRGIANEPAHKVGVSLLYAFLQDLDWEANDSVPSSLHLGVKLQLIVSLASKEVAPG